MKVSDLIAKLQECQRIVGDVEVFLHAKDYEYKFTYCGMGVTEWGYEFWLTADKQLKCESFESAEDFKVPAYKPDLKVVK